MICAAARSSCSPASSEVPHAPAIGRVAAAAADADRDAILALNATAVVETGPLDHDALSRLLDTAVILALEDQGRSGFAIVLDQHSHSPSPNFAYFRARYDRFVYIERIIIAAAQRGRGIARRFYADIASQAAAASYPWLCAEVNTDPPNPASHALHLACGFAALEDRTLANGKTVRYYARTLI